MSGERLLDGLVLAYVAGPYRATTIYGVKHNIIRAGNVADELWKLGVPNICPHRNSAFSDGLVPDHFWLDGDCEMLKRCDFVVVVPGWESSSGTKAEIALAKEQFLPVWFWPQDVEEILYFTTSRRLEIAPFEENGSVTSAAH